MIRSIIIPVFVLLASACTGDGAGDGNASAGSAAEDPSPNALQGEMYERDIVFLSTAGDSTLITPWSFRTLTGPYGVRRNARALLSRGGDWEPFFQEEWEGPTTRTPWRLLPRTPLRLVVGENDALDRLIFREGARELELLFGETVTEWAGSGGEIFRLQEGAVVLANQQVEGILLDIARARRLADPPGGDWAYLAGDDDFQLVLEDIQREDEGDVARTRAWTRSGEGSGPDEIQWPRVDVEWTEVRAFERARRDVPYGWAFTSSDQLLRGELTVRTAHLVAGEGAGPLLPVDALFEVSGTVYISGTTHEVRGLFRHVQH